MCNPTKTREARDLRDMLVHGNLVSIFYEGLMGDMVWISSNRRAYRLKDLGEGHLQNIIQKFRKNGEEVPKPILEEDERRRSASKS